MRPRSLAGALAAAALLAGASSCSSSDEAQPKLPRAQLLDANTCKTCHADHFKEWSGSMHAYASDDPVFRAMNERGQRVTNGALGNFCVNCHAPMAVREGATTDGLNLDQVPESLKGVGCFFCHSVDSVQGTHDAPLAIAKDLVMRGPFADPVANTAHEATYSPLHDRDKLESASACGACHDIVNGHGTAVERTFSEWQASVFNQAPAGATCGQCHMAESTNLEPVAQAPGVRGRRRHAHTFAGVDLALTDFPEIDAQKKENQALLDSTLQSALCVSTAGGTRVRVFLDNVAGGHSFPSGATQDRRVWTEVVAYSGANVIYQSGAFADGSDVIATADADAWVLRDCMFDGAAETHDFFAATATESNALPAQATFDSTDPRFYQTHVRRDFPFGGGAAPGGTPDRVTLRVRMQPMGLDVLRDLVSSGDLDTTVAAKMGVYDLGQVVEWTPSAPGPNDTLTIGGLPYSCVTKTAFNFKADSVDAPVHTKCKP